MAYLRRITTAFSSNQAHVLALIGLTGLALVLRLLVWRWHELYPWGGVEQEFLNQALSLLRTRQYVQAGDFAVKAHSSALRAKGAPICLRLIGSCERCVHASLVSGFVLSTSK